MLLKRPKTPQNKFYKTQSPFYSYLISVELENYDNVHGFQGFFFLTRESLLMVLGIENG